MNLFTRISRDGTIYWLDYDVRRRVLRDMDTVDEACETSVHACGMTTRSDRSVSLSIDGSDTLSSTATTVSSRHLPRSVTMTSTASTSRLQLQRKRFSEDGVPAFIACLWRAVHDAACVGVCGWTHDQVLEIRDREAFMRVFQSMATFERNATWASFVHRSRDWGFANKTQRKPYCLKLFHRSGLFVQHSTLPMLACIHRRNSHRVRFYTRGESTSPKETCAWPAHVRSSLYNKIVSFIL